MDSRNWGHVRQYALTLAREFQSPVQQDQRCLVAVRHPGGGSQLCVSLKVKLPGIATFPDHLNGGSRTQKVAEVPNRRPSDFQELG